MPRKNRPIASQRQEGGMRMSAAKQIVQDKSQYFEVPLSVIRANVKLEMDLYLYFSQNAHFLLWKKRGETPTPDFLEKYRKRSLKSVWVHLSEKDALDAYRLGKTSRSPLPTSSAHKDFAASTQGDFATSARGDF